jgi:integrase
MAKGSKILTRANMSKLKPGGVLRENGIEYHNKVREGGTWYINAMVDGQRIHRKIGKNGRSGQPGEYTLTDCIAALEKLKADAREDRLNLPKGRQAPMTFSQAAEEYLKREAEIGGKDLQRKTATLRLYLMPFFKNMPLAKLSTYDVERYKNQRLTQGTTLGGDRMSAKARKKGHAIGGQKKDTAPGTVTRELATLSHLLSRALEWGWITQKSAVVKRPKLDNARTDYLTAEECVALLTAADRDHDRNIWAFVYIALATGMRKSEILAIRYEHINLNRAIIHIPNAKAGKRDQPITMGLASFLAECIAVKKHFHLAGEWLFPANSASGHVVNITKPFKRVVLAAGLDPKKVTPHILRHTVISHLMQAGVDLSTTKRVTGHRSDSMVLRYGHQNDAHVQAAMNKLTERYAA